MRNHLERAFLTITLTVLAATTSSAQDHDVIVMPFACQVIDGKPLLSPSHTQAHRILGKREQRKVETCSPVDRKRCRQWTAMRFDMDCSGTRVSWMQVFANAMEHSRRRVWLKDGAIRVQDRPQRSAQLESICARSMGTSLEWSSTTQICEAVKTVDAPTATDMPAGFAPIVGLDARITTEETAARYGLDVPPLKIAGAPTERPVKRETPVSAHSTLATADHPAEIKPQVVHVEAPKSQPPPAATAGSEPPRQDVAQPATPASELTQQATPHPIVLATEPEQASIEPNPVSPTDTAVALAPPAQSPPQPIADPGLTKIPLPPAVAAPSAPIATASIETEIEAVGQEPRDFPMMIAVLAGLLLSATLALVTWLQRTPEPAKTGPKPHAPEQPQPARAPEPADPSPIAAKLDAVANALTVVAAPARIRPQSPVAYAPMALGDRLPSSRQEALTVLGMGLAADSNRASVKKVIDGLRMSWHPDFAEGEQDRLMREVRLRQINAAWDILGSEAAEA